MAEDIIAFNSEYIQQQSKLIENASGLIENAMQSLKSANRHTGWNCAERYTINERLNDADSMLNRLSGGMGVLGTVLGNAFAQFSALDNQATQQENTMSDAIPKRLPPNVIQKIFEAMDRILNDSATDTSGGMLPGISGMLPDISLITMIPQDPGNGPSAHVDGYPAETKKEWYEHVGDFFGDFFGGIKDTADKVIDYVHETVNHLIDKSPEIIKSTGDAAGNVIHETGNAAGNIIHETGDALEKVDLENLEKVLEQLLPLIMAA